MAAVGVGPVAVRDGIGHHLARHPQLPKAQRPADGVALLNELEHATDAADVRGIALLSQVRLGSVPRVLQDVRGLLVADRDKEVVRSLVLRRAGVLLGLKVRERRAARHPGQPVPRPTRRAASASGVSTWVCACS